MTAKSTVDEIRERFDKDVERFSNLETGQNATVDAPLVLQLVAEAAAEVTPRAQSVLDVGCGAGNYTLVLLGRLPGLRCTLLDLSRPMLDRARQRVSAVTSGEVETIQGDVRDVEFGEGCYDIIVAAMVFHHLRSDDEWRSVFSRMHRALRPGGSIWIADHLRHTIPEVESAMKARWGEYLVGLQGEAYRDRVFAYTEKEDTPQTLLYQTGLLREVGFEAVDVLHKNNMFAAFGARKRPLP